jgi:hypothetical protein
MSRMDGVVGEVGAGGEARRRRRGPQRLKLTEEMKAKLEAALADTFPIMNWLALGNHLFLLGSGGYFAMNFWRSVIGTSLNSSFGAAIATSVFFSLALVFICSACCYWIDCLAFPTAWTRRRCYHPVKRSKINIQAEHAGKGKLKTEMDVYNEASSDAGSYVPPRPAQVALPAPSHLSASAAPQSSPFLDQEDTLMRNRSSTWARIEETLDKQTWYQRLRCDRVWPWRHETWSELLNVLGALISFVACVLPYYLQTFRPDHALSFDSVPLSIALLELASMMAWLASALLIMYVWQRDQRSVAREAFERRMEAQTGVSIKQRRRMQKIEDDAHRRLLRAAQKAAEAGVPPPPSNGTEDGITASLIDQSTRFQPKSVHYWWKPSDLQYWSWVTNVLASSVYFCGSVWAVSVAVAVQTAAAHMSSGDTINAHNAHHFTDGGQYANKGDGLTISPQQVQQMIVQMRYISLVGDSIYVVCAILCELVYYNELFKEMMADRKTAKQQALAAQQTQQRNQLLNGSKATPTGDDDEEDDDAAEESSVVAASDADEDPSSVKKPSFWQRFRSSSSSSFSSNNSSSHMREMTVVIRGGAANGTEQPPSPSQKRSSTTRGEPESPSSHSKSGSKNPFSNNPFADEDNDSDEDEEAGRRAREFDAAFDNVAPAPAPKPSRPRK